jgi:hypothetical protein
MKVKALIRPILSAILISIFVGGIYSMAHAQPTCAEIGRTLAYPMNTPKNIQPKFVPGNSKSGPILSPLLRYGSTAPQGSIVGVGKNKERIEDWGLADFGSGKKEGFVILRKLETGKVRLARFSEFPEQAFRIKTISFDDVMKYQNELVVDRMLRDYPTMTKKTAQKAFDEMKKFLFVKFRAFMENRPAEKAPYMYDEIDTIDYAWHAFLLFTNHYGDFGRNYFSTFLHHKTQSFMDAQSGVIKAVEDNGPKPAVVNKKEILDYMRETLGDETYQRWFVEEEFNPHSPKGINRD